MSGLRTICAVVALLAICAAPDPGFAQDSIPVRMVPPPPPPEDALPPDQRLPFLWRFVQSDAPLAERRRAFRRALFKARESGDAPRMAIWDGRWRDFAAHEEARILAAHPQGMPPPPAPCNPDAPETEPARLTCGNFRLIDSELGLEYELLAEAAKNRGEMARYIASREAEVLYSHGTSPHATYWLALAREATRAGVYDAALRFCGVLEMRHYREHDRESERTVAECRANVHFAAGRWADWLAYFEPQLTEPRVGNTRLLVRYCVAASRASRREAAEHACDWAERSVRMRDGALNALGRAAARAASVGLDDSALLTDLRPAPGQTLADAILQSWRRDRPRVEEAISACVALQREPNAANAPLCAAPDDVLGLALRLEPPTQSRAGRRPR